MENYRITMSTLNPQELVRLVSAVFPRLPQDRCLAVLIDLPREPQQDNDDWQQRRRIAREWVLALDQAKAELQLQQVQLIAYADVGANNADLPAVAYRISGELPAEAGLLPEAGTQIPFEEILSQTQLFLVPSEYSATAPMKMAARRYGFRAATMAGFSAKMVPALRLDYQEVGRRVDLLKERLDRAQAAEVIWQVDNQRQCRMFFDLRFRPAHPSSGRFPDPGTAGNLPSGETYIVPYEGELEEKSRTQGELPVQFADGLVYYRVEENRAISVSGEGDAASREAALIVSEPAYANIAELGFGVLGDFGLEPIGEVLLDEKLGFHVAFGRSDHFGGRVGPAQFSSPQAVVHIDRIYIPATQPRVALRSVTLTMADRSQETVIADNDYLIFV